MLVRRNFPQLLEFLVASSMIVLSVTLVLILASISMSLHVLNFPKLLRSTKNELISSRLFSNTDNNIPSSSLYNYSKPMRLLSPSLEGTFQLNTDTYPAETVGIIPIGPESFNTASTTKPVPLDLNR